MRGFLLALLLLVAVPRFAEAHATLVRSTPAAGSVLSAAPRQIALVFSEEIEVALAKVSIVSSSGHVYQVWVHSDPHDVNALVGTVEGLPEGPFWLEWRIVSADGHPVSGRFAFGVGAGAVATLSPPASEDEIMAERESVPVVAGVVRGTTLGLLMALAGLLGFRHRAVGGISTASASRSDRSAAWLSGAAALFAIAHLVAWLMHVSPGGSLDTGSASDTLASEVGRLELARTVLSVLPAWAVLLARRCTVAMVFAIVALLVSGGIGHSAAISPVLATPAKVIHLLAGAVWLGGLVWLLTLERNDDSLLLEGRRVSSAALVAVVLVALSGFAQTFLFLPSLSDIVRTRYGAGILAKIIGLLVLIGFGAQHRFKSLPRLGHDPSTSRFFHGSLAREVAVMTIVIILGGMLAYVSPTQ